MNTLQGKTAEPDRRPDTRPRFLRLPSSNLTAAPQIVLPAGVEDVTSRVLLNERTGMRRRRRAIRRMLLVADVVALVCAWYLAAAVFPAQMDIIGPVQEAVILLLSLPLWVIGASAAGLYGFDEDRADHTTADDVVPIFMVVTTGTFLLSQTAELIMNAHPTPERIILFWGAAVVLITVARSVGRRVGRRAKSYRQRTLIVGSGATGQLLARKIALHPEYGLDLVGFADDGDHAPAPTWLDDVPTLGTVGEVPELVAEHAIDRVVVAFAGNPHEELPRLVRRLRDGGIQVDIVPRLYEVVGPKVDIHTIEGIALMGLPPVRLGTIDRVLKRSVDIAASAVALLALAPILAVIALLIRRDSPGPILFRQTRLGKDMKAFTLLKFRTMYVDTDDAQHREYIKASMGQAELHGSGQFKLSRDDDITRIGRFLRKTSLDELPQLVNVLRGEMSLVGPRPCLEYELEHFEDHHYERFLVPAGLTGLWQVSARAQATFGEALDLDVLYAQSSSFGLDLQLILRTPLQLLRSRATA